MALAKELVKQCFSTFDARFRGRYAIQTGLPLLDDAGGIHPGDIVVLSAEPGLGKTTLATMIADRAATSNISVLWFSLCETGVQTLERFLRIDAGCAPALLRAGHLQRQDMTNLTYAAATLSKSPLSIEDDVDLDAAAIRERVQAWRPPGEYVRALVVIDYLQLLADEHDPIAALRSLIGTAKHHGVAILLVSQQVADARERTAIESVATAVVYLRADVHSRELVLAKHRYRQTPVIEEVRLAGIAEKAGPAHL